MTKGKVAIVLKRQGLKTYGREKTRALIILPSGVDEGIGRHHVSVLFIVWRESGDQLQGIGVSVVSDKYSYIKPPGEILL